MTCVRLAACFAALACAGCGTLRQPGDAWWGPDKAKHFAISAALAAGCSYDLARDNDEAVAAAAGFGVAAALGAGKEVHDLRIKRTYFSGRDFVWDLAGGLLGGLVGVAAADP